MQFEWTPGTIGLILLGFSCMAGLIAHYGRVPLALAFTILLALFAGDELDLIDRFGPKVVEVAQQ